MPLPGGAADKFGNLYEGLWTVRSMIEILSERAISICLEPLGPEGEGVEFRLQRGIEKSEYHQVKRQHSEGRWTLAALNSKNVLASFRKKLREDTQASCVFISASLAYQLYELADRARRSSSWQAFHEWCLNTEGWKQDFEDLCTFWGSCPGEETYEVVKRVKAETISEDILRSEVEHLLDFLVKRDSVPTQGDDSATARDILAQFALESVHLTLSAHEIWDRLKERGYSRCDWGRDPHVLRKTEEITKHYVNQLRQSLIVGNVIPRSEVQAALQLLTKEGCQVLLFSAEAGRGKSSVLLQLAETLQTRDWPILAFRIDHLHPVLDPTAIGQQIGLPGSPVSVLAAIAQDKDCILIMDQLDAVSTISGRNTEFFECIDALLQQAQAHSHMRLILACRTFDLENDHRLRRLVGPNGIARKMLLDPLDEAVVKHVVQGLGIDADRLTQKQIALLSHPFHLNLFAGVVQAFPAKALSFQTAKELYYQFWDAKEAAVTQRLGRSVPWVPILDKLVSIMSEQQSFLVNESIVDQFRLEIKALVSEHVLIHTDRKYAFFHESFFDYVFARRFAAQGRALLPFLCESEQHLFRRAQVRQILLHERDIDLDLYFDDVRRLLTSDSIRFHIKQMVIALLVDLSDPREEEWRILALLANHTTDPCTEEIWRKLPYSLSWFQLLDDLGLIKQWLSSQHDQQIEHGFLFLLFVQRYMPDRVAELMEPYLSVDGWRPRFLRLFQMSELSIGRLFFELFLHCIQSGWFDETKEALAGNHSFFWTLLYALPTQQPAWACEAIGCYFDRCWDRCVSLHMTDPFSSELHLLPYTFHGSNSLVESATNAPWEFFEKIFLFMSKVMALNARKEGDPPWRDTVWGTPRSYYGGGYGASGTLLHAMVRALSCLAEKQPKIFELIAGLLSSLNWETAHYLLLRGYTANGAYFADTAVEYICNCTTDLAIGYDGEAHKVTRELLEAITPYCSDVALARLEQLLLHYYTGYERSRRSYQARSFFGQPTYFGHPQLKLLEGIVSSRRTEAVKKRIAEWRRKFGPMSTTPGLRVGSVQPPISSSAQAKMTDEQWLNALARYDQDTLDVRQDGTVVGGTHILAAQLERSAKADPHRFSRLLQKFPDTIHPGYFNAVLQGLVDAHLDTSTILDICKKCHALPGRPCGYWICTLLAANAECSLPQEALDIIGWYAVEGLQEQPEEWPTSLLESLDNHTDPITSSGAISVRGHAAEGIARLISFDGKTISFFYPSLECMIHDPSIAVRSCATLTLKAVFKHNREMGLSLFLQLCETDDVLLQTHPVQQFLIAAIDTHFETVLPIIQRMLQSIRPEVARVGARVACIASLLTEQAHTLAQHCLAGHEEQRVGAAEIFTGHLHIEDFRSFCEKAIRQLLCDSSSKVRSIAATCFNELRGDALGSYEELVEDFVISPTFVTNPYYLIHALENTTAKLPEITCQVCEVFFEKLKANKFHKEHQSFIRADVLSKLLLRVYSQQREKTLQTRMLDLIDRMLQFGEYGLEQVLVTYDR